MGGHSYIFRSGLQFSGRESCSLFTIGSLAVLICAFSFSWKLAREAEGRRAERFCIEYPVADWSIRCSGPDYDLMRLVFWVAGDRATFFLWLERSNLLKGHRSHGFSTFAGCILPPLSRSIGFSKVWHGKKLLFNWRCVMGQR